MWLCSESPCRKIISETYKSSEHIKALNLWNALPMDLNSFCLSKDYFKDGVLMVVLWRATYPSRALGGSSPEYIIGGGRRRRRRRHLKKSLGIIMLQCQVLWTFDKNDIDTWKNGMCVATDPVFSSAESIWFRNCEIIEWCVMWLIEIIRVYCQRTHSLASSLTNPLILYRENVCTYCTYYGVMLVERVHPV